MAEYAGEEEDHNSKQLIIATSEAGIDIRKPYETGVERGNDE